MQNDYSLEMWPETIFPSFSLKEASAFCTPRACNQGTSWSSSCGWTEELCSQHLSEVGVYRLIHFVVGVLHWKKEIVTTLQVQMSIGVRVQLLVGISRAVHGSGRVGSGLGLTRTRLDWIGLWKMRSATDPIYGSDPAVRVNGWMGRICWLDRFGPKLG